MAFDGAEYLTVDLDSLKWWGTVFHRLLQDVALIALWFKNEIKDLVKDEAKEFVEHRYHERRNIMLNIAVQEASFLNKLIPIIEASINNIGPALSNLGQDAGATVTAGTKLVADLKAFVYTVAKSANLPNPPTAA